MSWFTDFRDGLTAPARAIGGFFDDVLSGGNLFDAGKDYFKRTTAGAYAPVAFATTLPGVRDGLKFLDPVTGGVTGDLVDQGDLVNKFNREGKVSDSDFWKFERTQAKDAAIAAAAYFGGAAVYGAAGTAGAVAAGSVAAQSSGKFLKTGDARALAGLVPLAGASGLVPPGVSDGFDKFKDWYGLIPKGDSGPRGPAMTPDLYLNPTVGGGASSGSSLVPLALAGAAVVAVVALKGRR